jgi:hypothetical protein
MAEEQDLRAEAWEIATRLLRKTSEGQALLERFERVNEASLMMVGRAAYMFRELGWNVDPASSARILVFIWLWGLFSDAIVENPRSEGFLQLQMAYMSSLEKAGLLGRLESAWHRALEEEPPLGTARSTAGAQPDQPSPYDELERLLGATHGEAAVKEVLAQCSKQIHQDLGLAAMYSFQFGWHVDAAAAARTVLFVRLHDLMLPLTSASSEERVRLTIALMRAVEDNGVLTTLESEWHKVQAEEEPPLPAQE